jgi:hypothetical protein
MDIKPIKNESDYDAVLAEIAELMDARANTPDGPPKPAMCAMHRAGQPTCQRRGAVGRARDGPGACLDDPLRCPALHRQPRGAVHPVSPAQLTAAR